MSSLGRELVDKISFMTDYRAITGHLHLTDEMMQIIRRDNEFPSDNFFDVKPMLRRIRIEGTFIEVKELYDLRRSLDTIRRVVAFFHSDGDELPPYPYLAEQAQGVVTYPRLIAEIDRIIDKNGAVKDNASTTLQSIRRNIAATVSSISQILSGILRRAQSEGYVDRDGTP